MVKQIRNKFNIQTILEGFPIGKRDRLSELETFAKIVFLSNNLQHSNDENIMNLKQEHIEDLFRQALEINKDIEFPSYKEALLILNLKAVDIDLFNDNMQLDINNKYYNEAISLIKDLDKKKEINK